MSRPSGWPVAVRVVVALELLAVGVETGVRSAFESLTDVGLFLGLAAPVVAALALPAGWWRRLPYVVGWSGTIAYFSQEPSAGDIVLQAEWRSYVVLGVALALGLVALVTLWTPVVAAARGIPASRPALEDDDPEPQPDPPVPGRGTPFP